MTIRFYTDGLSREIRGEKAAGVESLSRRFLNTQRALNAEKNSLAVFDAVQLIKDSFAGFTFNEKKQVINSLLVLNGPFALSGSLCTAHVDAVIFPEDELIECTATLPHMGTEYIRFNL